VLEASPANHKISALHPYRFAEIQNTPPLYERWIKAGCEVSQ
jgi:hypothetical protein